MAASTPAATCGPAGRGCASSTESSGILPDFPWAEPCEANVRKVLLVLIGGGLLHGKCRHRVGLSSAALRPRVLIGGIVPPVGERGGGCFRKWALDASVARRAKA